MLAEAWVEVGHADAAAGLGDADVLAVAAGAGDPALEDVFAVAGAGRHRNRRLRRENCSRVLPLSMNDIGVVAEADTEEGTTGAPKVSVLALSPAPEESHNIRPGPTTYLKT